MWEAFGFSPTPSTEGRGYRIAGAIADNGVLSPPPTPPELVQLGAMDLSGVLADGGTYTRCFDWRVPAVPREVLDLDLMSVVHYWGLDPARAIELGPGDTVVFVEYLVAYIDYPLSVAVTVPSQVTCNRPTIFEVTASPVVIDGPDTSIYVAWTSADPSVQFAEPNARTTSVTVPGPGTYEIEVKAAIGAYSASASATVSVEDHDPPVVGPLRVAPSVLWPPNHRLWPVAVEAEVSDTCDAAPALRLRSVSSNEPVDSNGDGSTAGDIVGAELGQPDFAVFLRAERAGGGAGRVYVLTYEAEDASGNSSTSAISVSVPHSRRR
jgi:hypothetical protein